MELVIKIPEKTINEIKDNAMFADTIPSEILWDVTDAIVNGTTLPKGHGRIGDVDKLYGIFNKACEEYNIDNIAFMSEMDMNFYLAQTIVEADAESEG